MNARILYINLIFTLITSSLSYAQCKYQVKHTYGTVEIKETTITVESTGYVGELPDYCKETTPYFIGHSLEMDQSQDGSYIFTFDPPISMARLNFSGISNVTGATEEVSIYVNGVHYQVEKIGEPNGCDELAFIAPDGNIGVPLYTSVGGWLGTIIEGPISTLEIKDTVLQGTPAGALFSLFICPGIGVDLGPDTTLCYGESITLNATSKNVKYKWSDGSTSSKLKVTKPGTYWVEVSNKNGTSKDSVVVNYSSCSDPRSEKWREIRESGG